MRLQREERQEVDLSVKSLMHDYGRMNVMDPLSLVFSVLAALVIAFLIANVYRTQTIIRFPQQKKFLAGKVPDPVPEGLYQGRSRWKDVSWVGKKFDRATYTGINLFSKNGKTIERFPFRFYTGKGLRDPGIDVLAIDYNIPESPFYVRPILDEIVSLPDGSYLGKVHLRLIPGYPFTIEFFELRKQTT